MADIVKNHEDELYHYGVLGMKWGKRKAQPVSSTRKNYDGAKKAYKTANKEYSKAYNKAYRYSSNHLISQFSSKKRSQISDSNWNDVYDKAKKANQAKNAYKKAKNARKTAIKKQYEDLNKKASLGEKLVYNNATRKKAAKYIVDNNMSVKDATKKAKGDAFRNTAIFVAGYGAVSYAALKSMR